MPGQATKTQTLSVVSAQVHETRLGVERPLAGLWNKSLWQPANQSSYSDQLVLAISTVPLVRRILLVGDSVGSAGSAATDPGVLQSTTSSTTKVLLVLVHPTLTALALVPNRRASIYQAYHRARGPSTRCGRGLWVLRPLHDQSQACASTMPLLQPSGTRRRWLLSAPPAAEESPMSCTFFCLLPRETACLRGRLPP